MQAEPGISLEQTLEQKVSGFLSEIRADAGKMCMAELPITNTYSSISLRVCCPIVISMTICLLVP